MRTAIPAILLLLICAAGRAEPPAGDSVTAIIGATLIDGTARPPLPDSVVIIKADRIADAGKRGAVQIPAGAHLIDAEGLTLLPGLIDAHFHLDGRMDLPNLFLRHGITSVRDPGAWNQTYEPIRKSEAAVPRLFLCGPHLDCAPVAHPKDALIIKSAEEARNAANRLIDEGTTTIKVYFRLPLEWIGDVTKTAHARGTAVTAHLELVAADDAIRAGLDGIEHVTSFGTALADEKGAQSFRAAVSANNEARRKARYELWSAIDLDHCPALAKVLELAVKQKTILCPTLAVFEVREGGKAATEQSVRAYANMLRFTGLYVKAGGKIVVGSHSEVPKAEYGWAYQREMELLVEAGITPADVIRCATLEGAKYFRADDRLGSIEPGKQADLVLIEGDPLKDIAAMRRIGRVMLNGCWVDLKPPKTPATPRPDELLKPGKGDQK